MSFHRLLALAVCALLPTSVCHAATRDFSLESLQLAACHVADGHVTLGDWFDMADHVDISIEAEDAVGLIADPPLGVGDAECSRGKYIVKVDRALFPINVTRAGRYQRWSRAFFPQGGGWVHSESMDFGEEQWVTDCDGSNAGRWVWVKGPTYDLKPGVHLLWIHNWHGGARLDKIMLTPEGGAAPEGLGSAATRLTPAKEGWALSPTLVVPGLQRIDGVKWAYDAAGGEVKLGLSTDGGAHFGAIGPGAIDAKPGAPLKLRLRADIRRAANGAAPSLSAPQIDYTVDPKAFVSIEDDQARATFMRGTGALTGLFDKTAGVDCIAGADTAPPFELRYLPKGAAKPVAIAPEAMKLTSLEETPGGLMMTYRFSGDASARLSATLNGGELAWSVDVDNRSDLDIVEVECPRVPGVRLGDRSEDDFLITPNWQGGIETSDPVRTGGDQIGYPCGGAMAWLDLYEKRPEHGLYLSSHGLYLSSHDQALMGCVLRAVPQAGADALTFSVTKYAHVRPGSRWASPPAVIGLHSGDWHTAADAYRSWARTWMKEPNPPEWVREADGWLGLVVSADGPHIPFRRLPEFLKPMRQLGTNYIQVWGQMTGGVNCDALPYPNPVLGNLDEFKAAIREVQRWGGHITFYVSSQFWRVDYGEGDMLGTTPRAMIPAGVPTWDWNEWRNYAIRSYSGEFSGDSDLTAAEKAKYGVPWRRTVLCPFTDAWANEHLKYWTVDQYGANYGANGIYLDETNAASERICFAENHGHEHHGIWGASLTRDMKAMVEGGRQRDPGWTFATEGCGDAIGQYADINLISPACARKDGMWGANRRFAPEVFHYTFPEYILYNGEANGMYDKSSDDCFLDVHVLGNRYDTFGVSPAGPYVALRQRVKQLLYRARFMDNVGLSVGNSAVRAKINVLEDAQNNVRIINIANPAHIEDAVVTVKVAPAAGLAGCFFDLEGNEGKVSLREIAGGVAFTAPVSRASSVIIASKCEPLVCVPVTSIAAGDRGVLTVNLTNPTGQDLHGKLWLEGKPFGVALPTVSVTAPSLSTVELHIPCALPSSTPRGCAADHIRFEGTGFAVRRPVEILCTSPFEASAALQPGKVVLRVRNISRATQSGEVTVSGALWAQPQTEALSIAAGAQTSIDLTLPGGTSIAGAVDLAVDIKCAGQSDHQAVSVRPMVLNGGFERLDGAGRPTEWSYQNAAQAAGDAAGPASGKTALKLTGKPDAFVEADQVMPCETGRTYTARCKMRRTAGEGTVGPCIVMFPKAGAERYEHLKKLTDLPDDQWNEYEVTFTVGDDVNRTMFYLYNTNSTATVWYDDVSCE
jgi:hypothetical protein